MHINTLLRWYASKLDSHPLRTKIITSGLIAGTGDLLCQCIGPGTTEDKKVDNIININDGNMIYNHQLEQQQQQLQQHSVSSSSPTSQYDITRTAKFAFLGATLVAPATHVWYGYLMTKIPGVSLVSVGKRLALDQGLFAPVFLTTFVSCLTVLDHIVTSARMVNATMISDITTPTSAAAQPIHQHLLEVSIHNQCSSSSTSASTSTSIVMSSPPASPHPPPPPPPLQSLILNRIQNDVPQSLLVGWSIWIPSMAYMFAYVPGKYQVLFSNTVGFVWNVYLSWRTHQ